MPTSSSSSPPSLTSKITSKKSSAVTSNTPRAETPTFAKALSSQPSGLPFIKLENEHGLQNYSFAMHKLHGLRGGVPERGDHGEERHLRHQSEEVLRVHRIFRHAAMRRRVPGREHLRDRYELSALPGPRLGRARNGRLGYTLCRQIHPAPAPLRWRPRQRPAAPSNCRGLLGPCRGV